MPYQVRARDLQLLKKGVIRQNWSKVTLYNLTKLKRQREGRTFYQQKIEAKQTTRKYHGEHVTKRQWQNIFKHSLQSVVPMKTSALAASDGSEFGAGRGSGLDTFQGQPQQMSRNRRVPYMNQTFAPLERRLDMAIFRAMFASSSLQARQFVIHGFVKVNGKKMPHPQYMLNPGDMFQVDLDKILFATGAPKGKPRSLDPRFENRRKRSETSDKEATAAADEAAQTTEETTTEEASPAEESKKDVKSTDSSKDAKSSKDTEDADTDAEAAAETESDFIDDSGKPISQAPRKDKANSVHWWHDDNRDKEFDPTKPYRTPWRPRYYLSAFAFIPQYLEVNHNTGHAVYLRDPVARPGASEVPTPFHHDTMQLAYNWFLRRR